MTEPTPIQPDPATATPNQPSRRKFLGLAAAGAAATAGGLWTTRSDPRWPEAIAEPSGGQSAEGDIASVPESKTPSAPSNRTLVVLSLVGGNDGLATLQPYGNGRAHTLRGELIHAEEDLVILDDQMGLHPALGGMWDQGLAIVEGVGTKSNNLSHFEMERWWAHGATTSDYPDTGFLGRLCDELDTGAPLTGLSIGGMGYVPELQAAKATTAGLADPYAGWYFRDEGEWFAQFRQSVSDMGGATGGSTLAQTARGGQRGAIEFADLLAEFDEEDEDAFEYPGSELGESFSVVARLLRSESGIRVVHLPFGGFDTHDDQRGTHDYLLEQINGAVSAFQADLARTGHDSSTLIATTSEFGRRPKASAYGSDHGNASVALLAGPINPGRHGESPSLTNLDQNDNLATTTPLVDYYATLATWFGIDPTLVLEGNPTPLDGLLT